MVDTTYATLLDTVTSQTFNFVMSADWQPDVHEEGSIMWILNQEYPVKLTNGVKGNDGILTIVSTSEAMDTAVRLMRRNNNICKLTLPTGTYYCIMWDPAQDMKGSLPFSYINWSWLTVWTLKYFEVACP